MLLIVLQLGNRSRVPCSSFNRLDFCCILAAMLEDRSSAVMQDLIKQLITSLMLSAPPLVRAQLSEALSLISSHDFPAKWPVCTCWTL